jgi:hypothetical protein
MEQSLILNYFMLFIHVIQEHYACLTRTWRNTQENRTTTRHMALHWLNNDSSVGVTLLLDKGKGER